MIENYNPLTGAGHVLLAEIANVGSGLRTVLCGLYTKGAEVSNPAAVGTSLSGAMKYLAEGVDGDFPTRLLLLQTRLRQTVVFNNAWRSHGWFEVAFPLTKALGVEDTYFLLQRNTVGRIARDGGQFAGLQLIRLAFGEIVRSISLVNDGGRWVFTTQGQPAPFENVEQYAATKKSKRFSEATLKSYLAAMNLFPFQDDFYVVDEKHPAVGIDIEISRTPNELDRFPRIALKEIRDKYGPF